MPPLTKLGPTRVMIKPASSSTQLLLITSVVILTSGVFILDLFLPLGVAVGPAYAMPVLASLWWPGRRATTLSGIACTTFVLLDFFLSPPGAPLWVALFNRSIALFAIWSTAMLVLYRKRADEQIRILSGLLSICASCKKIRDERNHWKPFEDYIHDHSEAEFSHILCPQCLDDYQDVLKGRQKGATV
jgi:hypothetical protein